MNLFLHGAHSARVRLGDAIDNPAFTLGEQLEQFDVVATCHTITTHPGRTFKGIDNHRGFSRFHRGTPPKGSTSYALISHTVEIMASRGRACIVVPHGALFRAGPERVIRKKLLEENIIHAVIGLPAGLVFGSSVPIAIIVFDKRRVNDEKNEVLVIDGSCGVEVRKKQSILRKQDLDRIARAFHQFQDVNGYARRVSLEEIADNDYNLSVIRYVTDAEPEKVDIRECKREIAELESQLRSVEEEIDDHLSFLVHEEIDADYGLHEKE